MSTRPSSERESGKKRSVRVPLSAHSAPQPLWSERRRRPALMVHFTLPPAGQVGPAAVRHGADPLPPRGGRKMTRFRSRRLIFDVTQARSRGHPSERSGLWAVKCHHCVLPLRYTCEAGGGRSPSHITPRRPLAARRATEGMLGAWRRRYDGNKRIGPLQKCMKRAA